MVVLRPSICPTVRYGCTVAKRCEIGPTLLLITNRKSHNGFQMTFKSMIFDDLEASYIMHYGRGKLAIAHISETVRDTA